MTHTRDDIADKLVGWHLEDADGGIVAVYRYRSANAEPDGEPIKLLEVSRDTIPAGVMPLYFGPTKEIPYPVVLIEITPEEFTELEAGSLGEDLPAGWDERTELHPTPA